MFGVCVCSHIEKGKKKEEKTSYNDSKGLTNLKMSGKLVPERGRTNILDTQNTYNQESREQDMQG